RIGVSLPENLLEKFDEIITRRGYSSRSEGIRDAIRSYIRYYEWMSEVEGERIGILSMTYDHSQRGLVTSLLDLEHEFTAITRSAVHVHISHDECMEVLLLQGEGKDVRAIAEQVIRAFYRIN
ncbi:MAG: nickel-responsive transcriptional regulator NikR, partial [Candidatus Methanoperedens sp.]|nr:nickel-responsive transcriptional regulator NikR [Candidatus Methanoperedens sp.]